MVNNILVIIGLLLGCLLHEGESNVIFSNPTVFHSQYCNIGYQTPGTRSIPCVTLTPQQNIVSTAVAFTEYSKPSVSIFRMELDVSYFTDPTTTFNINIVYYNPVAGMYIGVFLVVIKQQTTNLYIDLVNLSNCYLINSLEWGTGSTLDIHSPTSGTNIQSVDLTTKSIFTTVLTDLITIPFVSSWRIVTPYNSSQNFNDAYVPIQFQLSSTITGNNLNVQLTVSSYNKVQQFRAFVLIFNPNEVTLAKNNGINIGYLIYSYSIGSILDLTTPAVDYGPGFNPRCILGFHHFKFLGVNTFLYSFSNTTLANYSVYKQLRSSTSQQQGTFFCFGNGTGCGQGYTHVDLINKQCYLVNTCPLPIFTGWTETDKCPSCIQLICETCDPATRNICTKCITNSNSHLVGTKCVCDTNYIDVLTPIDKSSLGLWNDNAQSLSECKINCSAVIEGCKTYDCTNSTFCTSCQTNYVVVIINSTNQNCMLCKDQIINCVTCVDMNICSQCETTSFMSKVVLFGIVISSSCPLCSSIMPHCTSCSDNQTCLTCQTGYIVNSTTKKCYCDKTYQNLQNCDYCQIPSQCSKCLDFFYLNITTFRCQPCSDIHNKCVNCSDQSTCTQCQSGFTLDSNRLSGLVTCTQCRLLILNCTECSSMTTCTNCDDFYGLDSQMCVLCDPLVMPGCLLCEDSSSCLTCVSSARMINSVCRFCNETPHCIDCFVTPILTLQCTQCSDGFYIFLGSSTTNTTCQSCQNVCSYCKQCLNENQCLSCFEPYMIGSTGICDQCISDYHYMGSFCMKQAGCINLYITPQGEEICLSCANQLHFIMNTTTKKCVCALGYKQYTPPNSLMTCVPICGDGIPLIGQEQCDDNNTQSEDGCDMNCKVQSNFECSISKPSKCVLKLEVKSFEFSYALRVIPQNKAILYFTIQPAVKAFKKLNWKKLLNLEFFSEAAVKLQSLNFQYSEETKQILITVPYSQELQETILQTTLKLDPTVIKSQGKQKFFMANQLKGKNAPLLFQSAESLSNFENINKISMIIIVILLVQFYLGSYTHKMIGLQTIQIIQTIYFVRMIASSSSSSLLQSMNAIQFSATGYQNAQLIFGDTYDIVKNEGFSSLSSQFIAINLEKYFLMNINLTFIPVLLAIFLFFLKLRQKIIKRKQFLETREQQVKENFIKKRRSCQWVYQHLVFPFVMMFNMICFFFSVLCFTTNTSAQSTKVKSIEIISFPLHILMLFCTVGIYCKQILGSIDGYILYRMSEQERQRRHLSLIEKLQEDNSNPDRANYHPLYVLIHSFYYLLLEICLVFGVLFKQFSNKLQLTLVISSGYFLLIIFWKPYHQSVTVHNKFLIFNHASLLIFLVICEVFAKVNKLPSSFYIASMYTIMVLLSLIMLGGFLRIFFENKFRKSLQNNSSLLDLINEPSNEGNKNDQKEKKDQTIKVLPKNFGLIANNPYVFDNQLKALSKKYGMGKSIEQLAVKSTNNKLSIQEEKYIVEKLREQYQRRKQQNFIKDILQKEDNPSIKMKNSSKMKNDNTFLFQDLSLNNFELNDQIKNKQFINSSELKTKNSDISTNYEQITRQKEIKAKLRNQLNQLFI